MDNFKQIDEARKLLGLEETATLKEIRDAYRQLAIQYHPDKCKEKKKKNCEEMFKKINNANKIILDYCTNYRYSFKEKNVKELSEDEEDTELFKRFYEDWWF